MKYVIYGPPVPQQRARSGRYSVYDAQKNVKMVQAITLRSQMNHEPYTDKPLRLTAIFYVQPPAKMNPKKREALIGTAHHIKPDKSNYLKYIEDIAVNAGILRDDCLISYGEQIKVYDHVARTEFRFREFTPETFQEMFNRIKEEIDRD